MSFFVQYVYWYLTVMYTNFSLEMPGCLSAVFAGIGSGIRPGSMGPLQLRKGGETPSVSPPLLRLISD